MSPLVSGIATGAFTPWSPTHQAYRPIVAAGAVDETPGTPLALTSTSGASTQLALRVMSPVELRPTSGCNDVPGAGGVTAIGAGTILPSGAFGSGSGMSGCAISFPLTSQVNGAVFAGSLLQTPV